MHFVEAAAAAALRSRMCRWWFAARKLLDSLRLYVLQRFVGETVAHSLQYKAFFPLFFFYSPKGQWNSSAECTTINTTVWAFFLFLNEFAIEFFSSAFIPHPRFCKYIFLWNSFSLMVTGLWWKKFTDILSNLVQFSVSPCEFISPSHRNFLF